jgi:hypothetical protein
MPADQVSTAPPPTGAGAEVTMTYREAMRQAISEALASDPRVFVMGEDVADYGGTYAVTKGLHQEFGTHRCPSRVSSGPASGPPWAVCDRSWRS